MTESEAREKWCPFVRAIQCHENAAEAYVAAGNRNCYGSVDDSHTCIASDCMAWRATDNEYEPCSPDDECRNYEGKPAGYCGLAGKP